jgi:hypothetical protein
MQDSSHNLISKQIEFLRRQYLQEGGLPFSDVLSEETISPALQALKACWYNRIYTPLVTLWVFLSQVLSADHGCRAAVARLIADRIARGKSPCSANSSAYCQARKRLPEGFFSDVACRVGRSLDAQADPKWLWKGRRVYMFDGTTVSMPDTPENQQEYPQNPSQKPGLGFPIARLGAIISLACGVVLSLGICRYAGKGQGERSLLRQQWDIFSPGDILLTDSLMSSWTEVVMLKQQGVDSVSRLNKALRNADFRTGTQLGHEDHIVRWPKPRTIRSVDRATYESLPDWLEVRELRVRVSQPGFRTRSLVVVTTLLDPLEATKEELASLFRMRWNNELDIRSIKIEMQMDVLRCKTPDLVRKEIWAHVLAYNLIRTVMAQSAIRHEIEPRTISFKGTLQLLQAFQPVIALQDHPDMEQLNRLYCELLDAVAVHRVADRPDRFEPRKRKRRPRKADRLMVPRSEFKRQILQGVT